MDADQPSAGSFFHADFQPDAVLALLEAALLGADDDVLRRCTPLIHLMRALAYETVHFERAVALLVRMARLPEGEFRSDHAGEILKSLFHMRLSGTDAPLHVRLPTVARLLHSDDDAEGALGVQLLRALLQVGPFSSGYGFAFGARSRGHGLCPRPGQETEDWYAAVLDLAAPFAPADGLTADAVRKAVAEASWGMCARGGQAEGLTRFASAVVGARGFWREGWTAVRRLRIYGRANLTPDARTKLVALEEALRPKGPIDAVRGIVLGASGLGVDLDDPGEGRAGVATLEQQRSTAERLAREVAADEAAFRTLLPDLIASNGYMLRVFSEGLAQSVEAPRAVWDALVAQAVASTQPRFIVPCSFLSGLRHRDPELLGELLEAALEDPALAPWFPTLQASVPIDDAALARLHRALDAGAAPIERYFGLGRACGDVAEADLGCLLLRIAEADGGDVIAHEILQMRLYADNQGERETGPDLRNVGRTLLSGLRFGQESGNRVVEDYGLAQIARIALAGEAGEATARGLSRTLADAIARDEMEAYEYDELVRAILEKQPFAALDGLFSGDADARARVAVSLRDLPRPAGIPMGVIPCDVVIAWCDRAPTERYPAAASAAALFTEADDEAPAAWTDLASRLLIGAPDPVGVFEAIVERLDPRGGSGSLAHALAASLDLLDRLDIAALPVLAKPMATARTALRGRIAWEQAEDSARNSRFE